MSSASANVTAGGFRIGSGPSGSALAFALASALAIADATGASNPADALGFADAEVASGGLGGSAGPHESIAALQAMATAPRAIAAMLLASASTAPRCAPARARAGEGVSRAPIHLEGSDRTTSAS
jgi:hypothetical protein